MDRFSSLPFYFNTTKRYLRNRIFEYYECPIYETISHTSYGFCNIFKFITRRWVQIVSNVYIMGLPHLLKVRWKGKMH